MIDIFKQIRLICEKNASKTLQHDLFKHLESNKKRER